MAVVFSALLQLVKVLQNYSQSLHSDHVLLSNMLDFFLLYRLLPFFICVTLYMISGLQNGETNPMQQQKHNIYNTYTVVFDFAEQDQSRGEDVKDVLLRERPKNGNRDVFD